MRILSLFVFVLLTACQPNVDDLKAFVSEVEQNTRVSIESYPEFSKTPAFVYEANQKRSPFQRPRGQVAERVQPQKANCMQPDFSRTKQPLERYGTDALSIKGFFSRNSKIWAMIQANDGSLHKASVGDRLGLFFGRITDISNGKVSITEMLPDGTGCWQEKQATLTMSSKAGENDNV
ncbi:pilus assembly protein PilP [Lacimicrobium alkaliphilum]|uniref:Pilus assembly protein PilP n=1 Tax=Lacimicrobium alkaliphilum TaxID=1526571 RepID=A0ABQ1RKI3_9ALTE|nr:pilus assembly protein PilP [Lacimicrobium alkaliphilum]GGD73620.1 pilus assembly protein PilP [Lacimicrobium alkaliphilum]